MSEFWTPKQRRFESTKEWLLGRRPVITASDSRGILGFGYSEESAMSVYAEKVSVAEPDDSEEEERFAIGHWMEPVMKKIFQRRHDIELRADRSPVLRISRDFEWLGATLDFHYYKRKRLIPVECKAVDSFQAAEWEKGTPLRVQIQVQHQMAVCCSPFAWVIAFAGPSRVFTRRIARDQQFIDAMLPRLHEFWCHVKTKSPPAPDFTKSCEQALNLLHPDDNGLAIELPESSSQIALELLQAEDYAKAIENAIRHRKNIIRTMMGDYTYGVVPGVGIFSWKTQEKRQHTVAATKFRQLRKIKKLPKAAEIVPNPYLEEYADVAYDTERIEGPAPELAVDPEGESLSDVHPDGGERED